MFIDAHQLDALAIARYEIRLRALSEVVLPPFLGSMIRGAFGHALKAIVCGMPHGECRRCLLAERCIYPKLFEPTANRGRGLLPKSQDAPRPFIFIPPIPNTDSHFGRGRADWLRLRMPVEAGESVVFGLSLLGDAIKDLPYIVYAIGLMARNGLGASRAPFALESVAVIDSQGNREVIYTPEMTSILPGARGKTTLGELTYTRLRQLDCNGELTLSFITPTRIRVNGEVTENLTLAMLVSSLSLRFSMLAQIHGESPISYDYKAMAELARGVKTRSTGLRLMALDRFSNRRGGKLKLDGFTGDICFSGPSVKELLPLIVAGEFLNVGSSTAFGLGRYSIVN